MTSPFVVNVADLLRSPGHRKRVRAIGPLPGIRVVDAEVPDDTDVVVDVELESLPEKLTATGAVTAAWVSTCRRCLAEVRGEVRADVREVFTERRLDDESWPITGDQIDLEPLARELVVLELPLAPLCRDDCAGLCPSCGADRNSGACTCRAAPVDPRWGALEALRVDLPEE
jgi:uncharacterized protein